MMRNMEDEAKAPSKLRFSGEEQEAAPDRAPPAPPNRKSASSRQHTRTRLQFTQEEADSLDTLSPEVKKQAAKVDRAAEKLDKAKGKLPKQRRAVLARATDEATGKGKVRLRFDEKVKPPSQPHQGGLPAPLSPSAELHREISHVEDENVGVEAAHSTEQRAESAVRFAEHSHRAGKLKDYRKAEEAERKLDKAAVKLLQKTEPLNSNPVSSNPVSRRQQKKAIQKSYYAAKAAGQTAASTAGTAAHGLADRAKKGVKAFAARKKHSILVLGLLAAMLAMLLNSMSACAPLVEGGLQAFVIATYPAEDSDILAAERYYKSKENELQDEMDHYERHHPGYDEYIVTAEDIWHDPHALISLISAHVADEWTINDVTGFEDLLFERQYTREETITTETRYRTEWQTEYEQVVDPETGAVDFIPHDVQVQLPYTYTTCTVTLDNFNLSHLPFYVLSRPGVGRYAMYISVLGNREDLFRGNPYASTIREPGKHDVPEAYLADESFRLLLEEAEKYIGYPYVWGGDSPETSFDCSGFISYIFTTTGVCSTGRLGATGLYGRARRITAEEARPGDLVFFEGTITGETGITHVGLYVGDGFILHCGSPIGYADLTERYWVQHFHSFGRLTPD